MLIYSFITDYQVFNLRYKDNTTRDKNETKVDKQSANLGKNNEPIQNRLSFLIDCKSVILHHLAILSFPMVRPAWDNWWFSKIRLPLQRISTAENFEGFYFAISWTELTKVDKSGQRLTDEREGKEQGSDLIWRTWHRGMSWQGLSMIDESSLRGCLHEIDCRTT